MFKYLFNGVLFQAETLEELQKKLVEAGYVGDVAAEFAAVNEHNEAIGEAETNFLEDLENMYEASKPMNDNDLQEIIEDTTPIVEQDDDNSFYTVTEDKLN